MTTVSTNTATTTPTPTTTTTTIPSNSVTYTNNGAPSSNGFVATPTPTTVVHTTMTSTVSNTSQTPALNISSTEKLTLAIAVVALVVCGIGLASVLKWGTRLGTNTSGQLTRVFESGIYGALVWLGANIASLGLDNSFLLQMQEPLALLVVLLKSLGIAPSLIPNPTPSTDTPVTGTTNVPVSTSSSVISGNPLIHTV